VDAVQVERSREAFRAWLHGPSSYLAAVARDELPVGETTELHGHRIEATSTGFIVDGTPTAPRTIDAGRYRLRLSHQNAPAIVVLDSEVAKASVQPRWFPNDPALRFVVLLESDDTRRTIRSTRAQDRDSLRVGWLTFTVDGTRCRLAVDQLLEPGGDSLSVFFRDATTGRETYEVGRYVDLERAGDEYVLDFNRAYNPACAYSPFYNCPIPPPENHLAVAIRAGEMAPLGH
jgi:uncharacterized protein (DUF1684 family)